MVYEHELGMGQRFKNHYESTKFQAEVWVQREMGIVPTTILRPGIVVGDSSTGETAKFDGPYYLLRTIAQLRRRGLHLAQIGRTRAPVHVGDYAPAIVAFFTEHEADPTLASARSL